MVEKLAERYKRCIIHCFAEATTRDMYENPSVVLYAELRSLEDSVVFLDFLKIIPLLFK